MDAGAADRCSQLGRGEVGTSGDVLSLSYGMLITSIQSHPVTTKQPDLVSVTCSLSCPLPRSIVHACMFCFELFSSHAGRATRQVQGSQDRALSLVCWVWSPCSQESSPGIWLISVRAGAEQDEAVTLAASRVTALK